MSELPPERSSTESHRLLPDGRRTAQSPLRNREAIAATLQDALPSEGTVLEIASGTGQHAAFFAPQLPSVRWQPSEVDPELLSSIEAWRRAAGVANLLSPVQLDVQQQPWPLSGVAALVCINMLHITPWEVGLALVRGAAESLRVGGVLFLYGPYLRDDRPTAPSNLEFDEQLRGRNPAWGLRRVEDVIAEGRRCGLRRRDVLEMPNNNHSIVLELRSS